MSQAKVRVLIVEDSPVVQALLAHVIEGDPRLEVVGIAASGEEAMRMLESVRADIVSLDIRLPGMDGFEVTQRIMSQHPLPIVVVASDVHDLGIPMKALQAGALAVVEKPGSLDRADYEAVARHLCTQLVIMSQVKVIRQRAERLTGRAGHSAPLEPPPQPERTGFAVLGLVASTGGPNALVKVLSGLPAAFPLPVAVVQHIGAPFVAGFASWLDSVCPQRVELATHATAMLPGRVYVAPGETHLAPEAGRLRLVGGDLVCGQRPSGDVLFSALAANYGVSAIGVLLTGMGEDGARGLLEMRRAGAYTIAEHASTAVIHGMPGTAIRLGAAQDILPLDAVAPRLLELVSANTGV